jgi:hypothetical protein
MEFTTTVLQARKTATGLPVPESVLDELGGGKRPAVVVTIGSYSYRSTVGAMNGQFLIPLSAEHRAASGIAAGDEVSVTLEPPSTRCRTRVGARSSTPWCRRRRPRPGSGGSTRLWRRCGARARRRVAGV